MSRTRWIAIALTLTGAVGLPAHTAAAPPGAEPALVSVVMVASGGDHTCALLSDTTLRCWGNNSDGEAGDGTTVTPHLLPVVVSNPGGTGPLTGVIRVAGGANHNCALLGTGQVRCWGNNTSGELGDGSTTDRTRPVVVSNPAGSGPLTGVTQLELGDDHTCARLTNGQARCWGDNVDGQLGNGSTTDSTRPVVVSNPAGTGPLTAVTQVSAGADHSCARLANSRARCWGENELGALGDGTVGDHLRPVAVVAVVGPGALLGVAEVTAGVFHSCARLTTGGVRCWGDNGIRELGDGTTTNSSRPVAVQTPGGDDDLGGVTQLSSQGGHTCARTSNGRLRCWGLNVDGQLGNGTTSLGPLPVEVRNLPGTAALTKVAIVSAGHRHTCARMNNTQVRCWGDNLDGPLGDNSTTDRPLPVVVRMS